MCHLYGPACMLHCYSNPERTNLLENFFLVPYFYKWRRKFRRKHVKADEADERKTEKPAPAGAG